MKFEHKVHYHIAQILNLPVEQISKAGTTIVPNAERAIEAWQPIWQIGEHSFVRCNPHWRAFFEEILSAKPENHCLQGADFPENEQGRTLHYSVDKQHFEAFTAAPNYHTRQLTQDDTVAFESFQAQCSDEDRDEGDVGLDHEVAFAVFDGERIVAVASSYELWGMIDIGILTDPNYRKQGLGKAVVSAISQHYLESDESRFLLYRHSANNLGSQALARGLNYQLFATTDYISIKQGE